MVPRVVGKRGDGTPPVPPVEAMPGVSGSDRTTLGEAQRADVAGPGRPTSRCVPENPSATPRGTGMRPGIGHGALGGFVATGLEVCISKMGRHVSRDFKPRRTAFPVTCKSPKSMLSKRKKKTQQEF